MAGALKSIMLAVAFIVPFAVHAQELNYDSLITTWATERGEIVTPSAQTAALRVAAEGFSVKAAAAGLNPEAVDRIAKAMTDAGFVVAKPHGVTAKWSTGEYTFAWEDTSQFAAISKALDAQMIYAALEQLPLVTVIVEPVPPVDYLVDINGEQVHSVKKGVYRVDPGDVVVRVARPTRPACLWKGSLKLGDQQTVTCKL
ncbi:hypothetical protein FJ941_28320 [Mesorhizobium sp. B2-3-13]|uniref:hypothetical protein n=1 Tax=Mesorhizobium sp. B2-3-13 TaxID=2589951 RepID=UPI00112C0E6D|nr:hypothetical protein [Mesorhizobium sp. B2-3-13]TPL71894.1 hypothetical protein FJ941_28320 [Mesorhizobium sp. B2-3-13]